MTLFKPFCKCLFCPSESVIFIVLFQCLRSSQCILSSYIRLYDVWLQDYNGRPLRNEDQNQCAYICQNWTVAIFHSSSLLIEEDDGETQPSHWQIMAAAKKLAFPCPVSTVTTTVRKNGRSREDFSSTGVCWHFNLMFQGKHQNPTLEFRLLAKSFMPLAEEGLLLARSRSFFSNDAGRS